MGPSKYLYHSHCPLSRYSPFLKTSSPFMMLCQVNKDSFFKETCKRLPCGKYLAFRAQVQSDLGVVISLHHCLVSIARLKEHMSLNPIPPSLFGYQNFHQEYQCIIVSSSSPHHKLAIIYAISLQIPLVKIIKHKKIQG